MTPEQIEALALARFVAAVRDMALEEAAGKLMEMHAIVGGMHNHYGYAAREIRALKTHPESRKGEE